MLGYSCSQPAQKRKRNKRNPKPRKKLTSKKTVPTRRRESNRETMNSYTSGEDDEKHCGELNEKIFFIQWKPKDGRHFTAGCAFIANQAEVAVCLNIYPNCRVSEPNRESRAIAGPCFFTFEAAGRLRVLFWLTLCVFDWYISVFVLVVPKSVQDNYA